MRPCSLRPYTGEATIAVSSFSRESNGGANAPSNGGADAAYPRWIRQAPVERLDPERLRAAKKAFTTRRVPFGSPSYDWSAATLLSGPQRPRSGDLVLASVSRIGHHARIELASGRRARLQVGDEIVVTYADRYAPDQFESEVPKDLGPTNLVASGGIASTVLSRHGSTRRATEIVPIGLISSNSSTPLNIAMFALQPREPERPRPRTVAVIGTSMNSGKTTAACSLITGLHRGGGLPGGTKVTGTGSGNDYWFMVDSGAHIVADFTDVGLASTYRVPYDVVEANFIRLIGLLTNSSCTDIVIEIADGLYQDETARLIRSAVFRAYVDQVIFTAADSMGAVAGVQHLRDLELPLAAVSGSFTRAELAMREVQANVDIPVASRDDLRAADVGSTLLSQGPVIDLRHFEPQVAQQASATGAGTAGGLT